MNRINGLVLGTGAIFFLMLLVSAPAFAQRGGFSPDTMRDRQEKQIKELVGKLELTDEQTPEFTRIMNESVTKRIDLLESMRNGVDRREVRSKFEAITLSTTEALKKILSEDQMKQYVQYQEKNRRRGRRRQDQ
jgi:hypothetical protein